MPDAAVSFLPTWAVPEIVGVPAFSGVVAGGDSTAADEPTCRNPVMSEILYVRQSKSPCQWSSETTTVPVSRLTDSTMATWPAEPMSYHQATSPLRGEVSTA